MIGSDDITAHALALPLDERVKLAQTLTHSMEDDGQAEYKNALVTFIDILGFRSMVSEELTQEIFDKLKVFSHVANPKNNNPTDGFSPFIFQFSDSVIRVRPVRPENPNRYGILFHELLELVHIQAELAKLGVLIRGGITFGEVFHNTKHLFGPAFIRAYELESNYALYPRVIIDPNLLSNLGENCKLLPYINNYKYELSYIKRNLRKSEDGFYFIDYLLAFREEMDCKDFYPSFLSAHKNVILHELNKNPIDLKVATKHRWLAHYHNLVVQSASKEWFRYEKSSQDSFMVPANETNILL